MARIDLIAKGNLPTPLREQWDAICAYAPFDHMLGAFAHRPSVFEHLFAMQAALRKEGALSRRHWELAQVAVSQLNDCTYCRAHHEPLLAKEGLSDPGVACLIDDKSHLELDAADKAVVACARAVTETPRQVPDHVFTELRRHFNDAQIVELVWQIALCGAFNRFNSALGLDIEPELTE